MPASPPRAYAAVRVLGPVASRYRPIFSPFAARQFTALEPGYTDETSLAQKQASNRNPAWVTAGVRCRCQFGRPLGHVDARLRANFLIKKSGPEAAFFRLWARMAQPVVSQIRTRIR